MVRLVAGARLEGVEFSGHLFRAQGSVSILSEIDVALRTQRAWNNCFVNNINLTDWNCRHFGVFAQIKNEQVSNKTQLIFYVQPSVKLMRDAYYGCISKTRLETTRLLFIDYMRECIVWIRGMYYIILYNMYCVNVYYAVFRLKINLCNHENRIFIVIWIGIEKSIMHSSFQYEWLNYNIILFENT